LYIQQDSSKIKFKKKHRNKINTSNTYMTARVPGLVQALQQKVAALQQFYGPTYTMTTNDVRFLEKKQ